MPYAYDDEMMLQCAMGSGDTNSTQHLHASGVCGTEVYSNVTEVKRQTF